MGPSKAAGSALTCWQSRRRRRQVGTRDGICGGDGRGGVSESTARLVKHIVMLAMPMIKAGESVGADSFTAGDTIEVVEPRTATTRPLPRGLCRGSTQPYVWRHAETP